MHAAGPRGLTQALWWEPGPCWVSGVVPGVVLAPALECWRILNKADILTKCLSGPEHRRQMLQIYGEQLPFK